MKKVLIIGYFWPYIGGSKRVIGLAKFLPRFGWQPIILTAPLQKKPDSEFRVIETDYYCFLGSWVRLLGLNSKVDIGDQLQARVKKTPSQLKSFLRFFYNLLREIIAYPDEHKKWKPAALKAADELFQKEKIDALISIYPVTSHLIANELKKKYKIPWIVDFPDLWSENVAYSYGPLRKLFDKRLERKTLLSADALITSSRPLIERLEKLHKGKSVYPITLGFDPDILNIPPAKLTSKFTITYTGIFYPKKRNPSKFLAALGKLVSGGVMDSKDIEVRFYGPEKEEIERDIRKYKLTNIVKQYGIIPLDECLKRQRESQLLLQLNWEDKKEKAVYSGKMPEYLAAQRPILAVGGLGDDVAKELLDETEAGVYCPEIEDVKNSLYQFYLEYKRKGKVSYGGNIEKIKKYSHIEMARKFTGILNQITQK